MKKTITLSDGVKITMTCPTVFVIKNAMKQDDEIEQTISIISATCNLSPKEIEDMPFPDFIVLQDNLQSFLKKLGK